MIIKKLNSMFRKHNRWLFGGFTVIIIVSFMGFLTPGQFGFDMFSNPENLAVGETFGEKITYGEFRGMARNLEIFGMLNGVRQEASPDQVFNNLCILRAAERMGVTAGDKEIAEAIKSSPVFLVNGKFSMAKWKDELKALRRNGVDEAEVFGAFRALLTIQKLFSTIGDSVTVSPAELESYCRRFNVGYEVKVASFSAADFRASVKPDGAALKRYFEDNASAYRIDGKVTSLLAEFPFAAFEADAAKSATPENLERFFKSNLTRFMKPTDTKLPEYAAVAAEVKKLYLENAVRDAALRCAADFAAAAYEALDGQPSADRVPTFRRLAGERHGKIIDGGTVDFSADAVGGIPSAQLVRQLVEAYESAPVTNAVAAEKGAYVGLAVARVAERPATFNEVAKRVNDDFIRDPAVAAAREAAADAAAKLADITDPAARAKAFDELKPCSFKEMKLSMDSIDYENFQIIDRATMLRPGEISAPCDTRDGAMLIELQKRIPADPAKFAEASEKYLAGYLRYRRDLALNGFFEQILARSRMDQSFFQRR